MTGAPDLNILLAFDYGLRRMGVATGNLLTNSATPLTTLDVGHGLPWNDLDTLLTEWRPGQLIVGLPNPDRSATVAEKAREFAQDLEHRYGLPVATIDESLTSRAAESVLREAREAGLMTRKVRKGQIDSGAACLIAEQWINNRLNEPSTD